MKDLICSHALMIVHEIFMQIMEIRLPYFIFIFSLLLAAVNINFVFIRLCQLIGPDNLEI